MQRALVAEARAIDAGQLDGAIRYGRARLTCIRRIDSGHCARRAIHRGLLLVLLPRGICRHHRCHRRTTTCERREGERGGGGPTFLCKRVPGDGASEWRSRQDISRAATIGGVRAPVCNDCAGRGRAPTAGLQHAPSGSVDAVERVTRGLRIEGLAAASASTFFLEGACRCLIGCLHHRRAHGLLVPADHARRAR